MFGVDFDMEVAFAKFVRRLAFERGAIVSSQECSAEEIAMARADNRLLVDDDNCGYVLRTKEWLDRVDGAWTLQQIRAGNFEMRDLDGNIILPEKLVGEIREMTAEEAALYDEYMKNFPIPMWSGSPTGWTGNWQKQ